MRTIAIVNQKGGCGKTTTAINLATVFARRGMRTLLVDLDPQAHCAAGLGVPEKRIEYSVADALVDDPARIDPTQLVWAVGRNLDLAPATMRLAALEAPGGGLHELAEKDRRLAIVLEKFAGRYDMCLVDCPPTIGLLTFNALRAARETLIPVETGYFALKGAKKQWETIQRVIKHIGRPIACHIVPTLHDPESELARDILVALRRHFAGQIVPVVIHEHQALREAASMGQGVVDYAPESGASRDYEDLAEWLVDHDVRPALDIEILQRHPPGPGPYGPEELSPAADDSGYASVMATTAATPAGAEAGPDDPAVRRPASRGDRAGELVQRLRGKGPASAESAQAIQHEIRQAIESAAAEAVPVVANPVVANPVVAPPAVAPPAIAPPAIAPPAIAPPAIAPVVIQPSLDEQVTGDPSHLYGVRLTSRGALFVQPDTGRPVRLAGDFNDWMPDRTPLHRNAEVGVVEVILPLSPGCYRYRVVVGDQWQADPYNANTMTNEHGEQHSVLVVPEAT